MSAPSFKYFFDPPELIGVHRHFLEILGAKGAFHGRAVEFFHLVEPHGAFDDPPDLEDLFRPLRQVPFLERFDTLAQPHVVAHIQPSLFPGAGQLAVETVPDLSFVGGLDVLGGHTDALVHVSVVLIHQGLDHVKVAVQARFQGPIETFGDGGFGVPRGGKMMDAFSVQPPLDGGIVKFFALVGVQGLGATPFLQNVLEGPHDFHLHLVLERTHPGIFGQDVHHHQQVTHAPVLTPEALHLHQVHHPLLVDVEDHDGGHLEATAGWSVQGAGQLLLQDVTGFCRTQSLSTCITAQPTQSTGSSRIGIGTESLRFLLGSFLLLLGHRTPHNQRPKRA